MRIFLVSLSLLAFSFSPSSSFGHQTPAYTLNKGQIWCAHSGGVAATYPVTCNAWGGTAFARKFEAEAEYIRIPATSPGNSGTLIWCGKSFKKSCSEAPSEAPKVWCATKHSIFETSESLCKSKGSKGYKYQEQAISQHLFLKGASSNYSYSDKIWCVEKWDYTYMPYGRCVARGGEVFASENQGKYSLASPAIASTQAWNSLFDNPDHDPGWSSNSY